MMKVVTLLSLSILFLLSACLGQKKESRKVQPTTEKYDNIITPENQSFSTQIVQKGDKWGMIDKDGKVIIPIEYKSIETNQGVIFAKNDVNEFYLFNYFGDLYFDTNIYNQLSFFPEKQV